MLWDLSRAMQVMGSVSAAWPLDCPVALAVARSRLFIHLGISIMGWSSTHCLS